MMTCVEINSVGPLLPSRLPPPRSPPPTPPPPSWSHCEGAPSISTSDDQLLKWSKWNGQKIKSIGEWATRSLLAASEECGDDVEDEDAAQMPVGGSHGTEDAELFGWGSNRPPTKFRLDSDRGYF